eukprot:XP_014007939.1 PREDICTED: serine/threonine-protein kinase 16-like [Salmo salar]
MARIQRQLLYRYVHLGVGVVSYAPERMGQTLCICSRGSITIDNKRYYFIQKLDEGGFSYVDLVEGVQDGRFYALKRILCHDREGRQEAQTEVEMHRLFSHPNILGLAGHTFIERGGKSEAWILLPYVQVRVRVCACLCNHACMCVLEPGHFFWGPILFFWGERQKLPIHLPIYCFTAWK